MDAKTAYLAGLIDGEGCITIIRSHERRGEKSYFRLRPRLFITNADADLMDWITANFGGRVHGRVKPSGRTVYQWVALDSNLGPLLERVRPMLIVKGKQADAVLDFFLVRWHRGPKGLSDEEKVRRHGCWLRVAKLNFAGGKTRKGPPRPDPDTVAIP